MFSIISFLACIIVTQNTTEILDYFLISIDFRHFLKYGNIIKVAKNLIKHKKLASQNFETSKTNCDGYGQNVKKQCFSKLFLGFHFWTFINVQFLMPFLRFVIDFFTFSKKIKKKKK
jgi:hypothetical protein